MKLPRDLSGLELIQRLRGYGYQVTRQVGSHIRIESSVRGHTHRVTVPNHPSLRLGTLSAIISEIAEYLNLERSELIRKLFENRFRILCRLHSLPFRHPQIPAGHLLWLIHAKHS